MGLNSHEFLKISVFEKSNLVVSFNEHVHKQSRNWTLVNITDHHPESFTHHTILPCCIPSGYSFKSLW